MQIQRSLFLVFLFSGVLLYSCVQKVSKPVFNVEKPVLISSIQKGHYKAKFSPDGSKLLFTDQSDNRLSVYDKNTNSQIILTRLINAGQEVFFTPEGDFVYYIVHDYSGKKKMSILYLQNVKTGMKEVIVDGVRNLKMVHGDHSSILYYENGIIREYNFTNSKVTEDIREQVGVFSDNDLNLAVFTKGKATLINPLGAGSYIWPSLSPDKEKVLFSVPGKGSYVSDLNGNILVELGRIHAPKWSPDGEWIIGMDDYDDGEKFTKSDIVLLSSDGKVKQVLTEKIMTIALYPEFSPDGKTIAFNDEVGTVYLMNLN